jgi:hypothetical protein
VTARLETGRLEGEDDELVTRDDEAPMDGHSSRCRCRDCDPDDARDRAADLADGP